MSIGLPLISLGLNSVGQQFYQYQQKKQSSLTSSLNMKNTPIYDIGNPGSGLGQAQICDRVKLVKWMSTLPLLWWSSFLCFLQFFFFSFTFTLGCQFPLQIWWSSVGHPQVHKASPGVLFSSVKMIVLETKILRIISIQLKQIDWNSYNFH